MADLRIAIVVPRYGQAVGGGAEALARQYATHLARRMDVTVLTTCALEYRTWRDHFPEGTTTEDGVRVCRFSVPRPRVPGEFDALSSVVLTGGERDAAAESAWMDAQGPNAPGLIDHLAKVGDRYDAVMFIPYLYATTARGLPLVADRAVLVPALHDEPPLRLEIFRPIVEGVRALVLSTPEERDLALARFAIDPARCHLVGAGIDSPPLSPSGASDFAEAHGLQRPYLVCVGRIDPSKGSDALLEHHDAYRASAPEGLDLVMLGPHVMPLPSKPWLLAPGFVSDDQKHAAIAGATALVCPSSYESLSLVLLEAWSHGVPTIVTAGSDVLVGQSRRAGAGLWYRNGAEYAACVDLLDKAAALRRALGRSGWRFAQRLEWPRIVDRLEVAIRQATGARKPEVAEA